MTTALTKPIIHFAHANGIPAPVYRKMLEPLSESFDIVFADTLGTHPKYPVDNHWQSMTQQIINSIESQARGQPVIALGHSLGATLSLHVAYHRPDLISQVIMLDPALFYGKASLALHGVKMLSVSRLLAPYLIDKVSPSGKTLKRRDVWADRTSMKASLGKKRLFQSFDTDCFEDYILYGASDTEDGRVTLTIPKHIEATIYRTMPSLQWLTMRRPPPVPAVYVSGKDSEFRKTKAPQLLKRKLGIDFVTQQGGHMFPLEHPLATAALIETLIRRLHWIS